MQKMDGNAFLRSGGLLEGIYPQNAGVSKRIRSDDLEAIRRFGHRGKLWPFVLMTFVLALSLLALPVGDVVAFADTTDGNSSAMQDDAETNGHRTTASEEEDSSDATSNERHDSEKQPSTNKNNNAASSQSKPQAKGKLVDSTRKGSIKVRLLLDGKPVSNVSVRLDRVSSLEWDTSTGAWNWSAEAGYESIDMESLGANDEEELSEAVNQSSMSKPKSQDVSQVVISDAKGEISFSNLELGLYLLQIVEEGKNNAIELSPFCISLPSDEGGAYSYDIDATPKLVLAKAPHPTEQHQAEQGSPLPKTGDETAFLAAIILVAIMVISIGVWMVSWLVERKRLKRQLKNLPSDELMLKLDCSTKENLSELTQDRSKFTRRLILTFCLFAFVAALFFLFSPKEALGVERVNIDTSNGVSSATAFKLGVNQSPAIEFKNGTTKADFDNGNRREITAKIPNSKGAWTVSNPVKLTYNNAGSLNNRKVKVVVNIDSVRFKKGGKDSNNGFKHGSYVTIAHMTGSSLFIGCRSKDNTYGISNNNGYTIKTSVSFMWADTGEVINLPFIQGVYDIDQYDSDEAWEAISGFSKYIVYKGTNLSQSGNKFYLSKDYGSLNDDASKYKGGLYATTHNGSFQSDFYGANCDAQLVLYNQLMQLTPPVKSVSNATPKPNEEIEWTVDQKIGTYIKDSFTGYSSLRFSDTLDERLDYVSSAMLEGSSDITKMAGNLSYDESSRKVSFDFDRSWLSSMENYKGQTLRLKIKTRVKKDTYGQTIPNKAIVTNSNVNFEADSKVDVPKYQASGSWVPRSHKRLDGAELKEGQFKFRILSSDGTVLDESTNKANGDVVFKEIKYTQDDDGKTYKYKIVEVEGSEPGVTYDTDSHDVQVKVVDNKDETLTVTPAYEDGKVPEFVNYALTYSDAPYPTTGGPGVAFVLVGLLLVAGGFALRKMRS